MASPRTIIIGAGRLGSTIARSLNKSSNVIVIDCSKEKIDRLTEELAMDEQKITFLEQSVEKRRRELEELKNEKNAMEREVTDMKAKASRGL